MSVVDSEDSRTMDGFQTPSHTAAETATVDGGILTPSGVSATSGGDIGDDPSQSKSTGGWIKNEEWAESPHAKAPILGDSKRIPTLMKGLVLATLPYTNKSFHEATDGYFNIDVSRGATVFRPPAEMDNDTLASIALDEMSRYLSNFQPANSHADAFKLVQLCQSALEPLKQSRAESKKNLDAAMKCAGLDNEGTNNLVDSVMLMSDVVQEALRPYVEDKISRMDQTDAQVAEDEDDDFGQITVLCHMPSHASSVWNTVRALLSLEEEKEITHCPSMQVTINMNDISAGLVNLAGDDSRITPKIFEKSRQALLKRFPQAREDQMSDKWNSIKDAGGSVLRMYLQRVDDTDTLSKGIIDGLTAMGSLLVHGLSEAEHSDSDDSGSIDLALDALSDTASELGLE